MIRGVGELVSFVSSAFTLLPGDVIMTGTPAGVGLVQPATATKWRSRASAPVQPGGPPLAGDGVALPGW